MLTEMLGLEACKGPSLSHPVSQDRISCYITPRVLRKKCCILAYNARVLKIWVHLGFTYHYRIMNKTEQEKQNQLSLAKMEQKLRELQKIQACAEKKCSICQTCFPLVLDTSKKSAGKNNTVLFKI